MFLYLRPVKRKGKISGLFPYKSEGKKFRCIKNMVWYVARSLYTGEPMRQQKNLVVLDYRVEFD